MNYKKVEVLVNNKIDEDFNDFLDGKINSFNSSIKGNLKEPVKNSDIEISVGFEGIIYGNNKRKIKITCDIKNDKEVLTDSFNMFDYYEMYYMFELTFQDNIYKIILKPKIEKTDNKIDIYNRLQKVYGTNPQISTEILIRYTNFKDIEESFYLCLVLMSLKITNTIFHNYMMGTLYSKLQYYGYENDDNYSAIKHRIFNYKTDEDLVQAFLYTVYYFTFREKITHTDYKLFFDIIWGTYNKF